MITSEFFNDILKVIINAHEEILKIYNKDFEISYKNDKSPLTEADLISNKIICDYLKSNTDIPIISEENKDIDFQVRKDWELCFLVDPIDGTKEFIKKNGQFTTNIALIKNGSSIYGFVGVPVEKKIYFGGEYYSSFCFDYSKNKITEIEPKKNNPLKIVASNSHMNEATKNYLKKYANIVNYGSSLKIIKLACGDADLYPRLAPTMEWDTAAADVVLRCVGGALINYENNQPLKYNKENLLNSYFIGYNFREL